MPEKDLLPKNFIERGSFYFELLSSDFETIRGEKSTVDIAVTRLAQWCKYSANGDWSRFSERLRRDNLNVEFILERFGGARFNYEKIKEPEWVVDSRWILDNLVNQHEIFKIHSNLITDIPFNSLYFNLLNASVERLTNLSSLINSNFIDLNVLGQLQEQLLLKISELCSDALLEKFKKFKQDEKSSFKEISISSINKENYIYKNFIQYMHAEGFIVLFEEKPVLLRLLSILIRQWIDAIKELLDRIFDDKEEVANFFQFELDEIQIKKIVIGLSDLHNSGKEVAIIELNNNIKIVYKPRDLSLDKFWEKLIENLNSQNHKISLKAPKVLLRKNYGWVEFIEHKECISKDEVADFYKKLGAFLAIFHIVIGSDIHYENIIASGVNPVPIDIEMLFQISFIDDSEISTESSSLKLAASKTIDSVLGIGLLPTYSKISNNKIVETGGVSNRRTTVRRKKWISINTDEMHYILIEEIMPELQNIPIHGLDIDLFPKYLNEFIIGFKEYSLFLISLREKHSKSWITNKAAGLYVRKILKPTNFYSGLMSRLTDHRKMSDGILWSTELDFVSRFADWSVDNDRLWPVVNSEINSLSSLNYPIFYSSVDGKILKDYSTFIINIDCKSALIKSQDKYSNFDIEEVNWQCEVIRSTVSSMSVYNRISILNESEYSVDANQENISSKYFRAEATAIAETLLASSFEDSNSIAWIGMESMGDSEYSQLSPLGFDLYNGSSGIAVFLAAYGKVLKDSRFIGLANKSFFNLKKEIYSANANRFARKVGIGGGLGLGSIIYAQTVVASITGCNDLLKDAERCVSLISSDLIKSDISFDILGGSAGAILGLLKLYKVTGYKPALDKALECGERLLDVPRTGDSDGKSLHCSEYFDAPQTGLSHGASGFAYAFASLASISDESKYLDASLDCLLYEDGLYSTEFSNWPDFRKGIPEEKKYKTCQWCNGAIGIGLSRIAMLKNSKLGLKFRQLIDLDIERVSKAIKRYEFNDLDTLCCGRLAQIELLNETSIKNNDAEIYKQARIKMYDLISKARTTGAYSFGLGPNNFHVSLFRGISGVGYSSLRMVDQNLPNILIWD